MVSEYYDPIKLILHSKNTQIWGELTNTSDKTKTLLQTNSAHHFKIKQTRFWMLRSYSHFLGERAMLFLGSRTNVLAKHYLLRNRLFWHGWLRHVHP